MSKNTKSVVKDVKAGKIVAMAKKLAKAKTPTSEAYDKLRKQFRVERVTPFFRREGFKYTTRARKAA